jgi:hypothetical protein
MTESLNQHAKRTYSFRAIQRGSALVWTVVGVAALVASAASIGIWLAPDAQSQQESNDPIIAPAPDAPREREPADAVLEQLLRAIDRQDYSTVRVFAKSLFENRDDIEIATAMSGLNDPVLRAVNNGNLAVLEALAEAEPVFGATDERGRRAVHVAAAANHAEVLTWLLNHTTSAADDRIRVTQSTPLHVAARQNAPDATRALVQAGAAVDARDAQDRTPLMVAAAEGNLRVIEVLLAAPESTTIDAQDADGLTALHHAATRGDAEAIIALLDAGADPQKKTAGGMRPAAMLPASTADDVRSLLHP